MIELKHRHGVDSFGNTVATDMDDVFFGGQEVGQIGRFDGANMSLFYPMSDADRKQLTVALNKARAEQGYTTPAEVHGHPVSAAQVAMFLEANGQGEDE
jgi:hypothetical protein